MVEKAIDAGSVYCPCALTRLLKMNCVKELFAVGKFALLIGPILSAAPQIAFASDAAWIFAHRANTVATVDAAAADQGVNGIEVDISFRARLKPKERGSCKEPWCAFHDGDPGAVDLSLILSAVRASSTLHAVWLDVKHTRESTKDYETLVGVVGNNLGRGPAAVRKFWGVWPVSELTSTYTTHVVDRIHGGRWLGDQSHNILIVEVDGPAEAAKAASQCAKKRIQCGLSAGSPFAGNGAHPDALGNAFSDPLGTALSSMNNPPSTDKVLMLLLNGQLSHPHINSLFSWTFNWRGPNEDDMVRLMFRNRGYREKLMGLKRQCALEGNGLIVGPQNDLYSRDFCSNGDAGDICSVAGAEINAGPNSYGNRASNIGAARNTYSTVGNGC